MADQKLTYYVSTEHQRKDAVKFFISTPSFSFLSLITNQEFPFKTTCPQCV